jgi:hypothetical protein
MLIGPEALIVDQSNKFLYVVNLWDDSVSVFARNVSSGAITLLSTMLTHTFPAGIAVAGGANPVTYVPASAYVSRAGTLITPATPGSLLAYSIDASTGGLSPRFHKGNILVTIGLHVFPLLHLSTSPTRLD